MEQVPLGASGLMTSRLGYGCAGPCRQVRDDAETATAVRHAFELGITFFDCGDGGVPHSERLVGRVFGGRSDDVVLATTFGPVGDPAARRRAAGRSRDVHAVVHAACDASLRRLGVEVIDLCYLPVPGPAASVEETVGAAARLVTAGKVRALGLCEAAPAVVRRAHAVHPIAALRAELSLWSRHAEGGLLRVCRDLGITFVAYRPLGSSAASATGSAAAGSRRARLRDMAAELGCSPGQLALAWVLARGRGVVPLSGARDRNELEEYVAAVHAAPDPAHVRALDAVFTPRGHCGQLVRP